MGNGPVKHVAIIINGDTEARHLVNVDRSLKVLEAKGYETYVVSTKEPTAAHDHYITASTENIVKLREELNAKMGSEDEVVIYTTGHGDIEGENGSVCLPNGCSSNAIKELDQIRYGKRTVIMDQCYGGNSARLFLDDPKTLFISSGSKEETVCCGEFAPHFWGDVPDANKDGSVSWQERYEHAMNTGKPVRSFSQFIWSPGYSPEGKPPFDANVKTVGTKEEMDKALHSLKPGQYAVVMYSAPWCGACKTYKPAFDGYAKEANGAALFIYTENEELLNEYVPGANSYPTVAAFDSRGVKYVFTDEERTHLPQALTAFHATKEERFRYWIEKKKELQKDIESPDDKVCLKAYSDYLSMSPKTDDPRVVRDRMATARKLLCGRDYRIGNRAISEYRHLSKFLSDDDVKAEEKALRALSSDGDYPDIFIAYKELATRLDNKTAIDGYGDFLKKWPKSTSALMSRAEVERKEGLFYEALADCNMAIKYDAWSNEPYLQRGYVYQELEEYDKAMAEFNTVISRPSDNSKAEAYIARAGLLERDCDHKGALADYEKAVSLSKTESQGSTNRIDAPYALSTYYKKMKRYDDAIKCLDECVLESSDSKTVSKYFLERGILRYKKGDLSGCREDCRSAAIAEGGASADALYYMYISDFALKGPEPQTEMMVYEYMMKKAGEGKLQDASLMPDIYYSLGRAYIRNGRKEDAMKCFIEAKKLDPLNLKYSNAISNFSMP